MRGIATAIGSGFLWSWLYCLWFARTEAVAGSLITADDATWLASMLIAAAAQIIFLLDRKRVAAVLVNPVSVMAAGLLMGVFSFVFCLGGAALNALATWVVCVTNAFLSGVLWSAWGFAYDEIDMDTFRRAVPLAAVVVLPAMALCRLLPGVALAAFIALLPVISSLLLVMMRRLSWKVHSAVPLSEEKAAKARSIAQGLGLTVMLVGAVLYFGLIVLMKAAGVAAHASAAGVAIGAVLVALLAVVLLVRRSSCITRFMKWLLWLSIVAFAVAACDAALACVLLGTAVFGVDFFAILMFALIASRGYLATSTAFIMGESLVEIGFSVGYLAGVVAVDALGAPAMAALIAGAIGAMTLLLIQLLSQQSNIELLTLSSRSAVQDEARLERVAAAYSLSKREAEVLAYLAQGRTVAYVSDALFISTNTVDTHVRHIYGKMGIHSRQELLDLVRAENE